MFERRYVHDHVIKTFNEAHKTAEFYILLL